MFTCRGQPETWAERGARGPHQRADVANRGLLMPIVTKIILRVLGKIYATYWPSNWVCTRWHILVCARPCCTLASLSENTRTVGNHNTPDGRVFSGTCSLTLADHSSLNKSKMMIDPDTPHPTATRKSSEDEGILQQCCLLKYWNRVVAHGKKLFATSVQREWRITWRMLIQSWSSCYSL
ncbi:hypothetical protein BC835DRAFT_1436057 [Cytidiella melzeri]|nr:hypothetical protein BC835DRAFT_1436057 [Cytidiella melzeri]